MKLYFRIKQNDQDQPINERIIEDVKFETLGCGAAIATSSMITELVKGKSLEEALKVTNKNVFI